MADPKLVIRQEKDDPEGWHVAAQSEDADLMAETARNLARAENTTFVAKENGDILGNSVDFFILDRSDLADGFGKTI